MNYFSHVFERERVAPVKEVHDQLSIAVNKDEMIPKVGATAGCPPAHSLLPSQAAAEELKTMVHFMGHFHARSGRYLNISKKVL